MWKLLYFKITFICNNLHHIFFLPLINADSKTVKCDKRIWCYGRRQGAAILLSVRQTAVNGQPHTHTHTCAAARCSRSLWMQYIILTQWGNENSLQRSVTDSNMSAVPEENRFANLLFFQFWKYSDSIFRFLFHFIYS